MIVEILTVKLDVHNVKNAQNVPGVIVPHYTAIAMLSASYARSVLLVLEMDAVSRNVELNLQNGMDREANVHEKFNTAERKEVKQ